jgi:preprotein translocase subunit SecA
MRRGIGLRGYGQRDPLVEYKKEAYRLYHELNDLIRKQVVYSIFKTAAALAATPNLINMMAAGEPAKPLNFQGAAKEMDRQANSRNTFDLVSEKAKNEEGEKVGRNDLCPCGSGKKYKKCCGK